MRESRRPTTTERTSKQWKAITAVSAIAFLVGLLIVAASDSDLGKGIGGLLIVGAILGAIAARMGAWWANG